MNVGQILETHLGWAAGEPGKQIGKAIAEGNGAPEADAIRKRLREFFGKEAGDFVDDLKDEDVLTLARKSSNGIHVASPVFDGASEDEILALLRRAALPHTGQATLFDGRSGQSFAQNVTVGVLYMMKLHHL